MQRYFVLGLVCAALVACGSTRINTQEAIGAQMIEMQVNDKGTPVEVEYHVSPDEVPAAVRKAMDGLHPGGRFTGAEKEWHGGKLYWELTRVVRGMEVEAMFTPDGQLFSEEVQVGADKVPGEVKRAAMGAVPGARVTKWEEIRDGNRSLVEYHVKATGGNKKYKIVVSLEGKVEAVFREIPGEIEVNTAVGR